MPTSQTMSLGSTPTGFASRARATLRRRTEGRAVILLVLVVIGAMIYAPTVFTAYQVTLGFVALIGLIALGLTMVILMG